MVTIIGRALDSKIGEWLTSVLKLSAKVTNMTIKSAASFLKVHWHHIRPVYLAHLLRTSPLGERVHDAITKVEKATTTIFSSIAASLVESAKRAPLLLLTDRQAKPSTASAPLLLTYKPESDDEKRKTHSSRPRSKRSHPRHRA